MYDQYLLSKDKIFADVYGIQDANYSGEWRTQKIALHWVVLKPNQRSSIPHAESLEEEFVYVVSGNPHLWSNGYICPLEPGVSVGFPSGSGITHTFINNTSEDVQLVVLGERSKKENKYIYPLSPELQVEHEKNWWRDWPKQIMGPNSGRAGDLSGEKNRLDLDFVKSISDLERAPSFSYRGDSETFSNGIRLTKYLNLKAVGVWHEKMMPGHRSSWPHAHKLEEEYAVLLKGRAKVWLNGVIYNMQPGDAVFFKPGTNIAHTLINDSSEEIEFLGVGEADDAGPEEKIIYPLHQSRNEWNVEQGYFWPDAPVTTLNTHQGFPEAKNVVIKNIPTAVEFLKEVKSIFEKSEAEYGLIFGLSRAQALSTNPLTTFKYFSVFQNEKLVGAFFVNSHSMVMTQIPGPLIPLIVSKLKNEGVTLPGVVGPAHATETFARLWSEAQVCKSKLATNQKIYELRKVISPASTSIPISSAGAIDTGELFQATVEQEALVTDWWYQFVLEALPNEKYEKSAVAKTVRQKIQAGDIFLWKLPSGQFVAMNARNRPTDKGITVSMVYTPPEVRRRGYAGALVTATSQMLLDKGFEFCALYTDATNSTSNKIYQNIGYVEVARSKHFIFS